MTSHDEPDDREVLLFPQRGELLAMAAEPLATHIREMWERESLHGPDFETVFGAGQIARRRGLALEGALLEWVQADGRPQRIVVAALFLHPYWLGGERIEIRLVERLVEALETRRCEAHDEVMVAAAAAQAFNRVADEWLRQRLRTQVVELAARSGPEGNVFLKHAHRQVLRR